MSKKSRPFLCSLYTMETGQDLRDIQYLHSELNRKKRLDLLKLIIKWLIRHLKSLKAAALFKKSNNSFFNGKPYNHIALKS